MGQGGWEVALLLNSIGQLNLAQRNSRQSPLAMSHFFPHMVCHQSYTLSYTKA